MFVKQTEEHYQANDEKIIGIPIDDSWNSNLATLAQLLFVIERKSRVPSIDN